MKRPHRKPAAGLRVAVEALLERQRREILALLDDSGPTTARPSEVPTEAKPVAAPADTPEWTTLARAAAYCGVTAETLAGRCKRYGLGWRAGGGPWQVDLARVRRWLDGKPYERLPAAMPHDSARSVTNPDEADPPSVAD